MSALLRGKKGRRLAWQKKWDLRESARAERRRVGMEMEASLLASRDHLDGDRGTAESKGIAGMGFPSPQLSHPFFGGLLANDKRPAASPPPPSAARARADSPPVLNLKNCGCLGGGEQSDEEGTEELSFSLSLDAGSSASPSPVARDWRGDALPPVKGSPPRPQRGDPTSVFREAEVCQQEARDCFALGNVERAAELGLAEAQAVMAERCNDQIGAGALDEAGELLAADCFSWALRAAQQGNRKAIFRVARCYVRGVGVAKNQAEGTSWFREAANIGCLASMVYLGSALEGGIGCTKDGAEAALWYRRAAGGVRENYWESFGAQMTSPTFSLLSLSLLLHGITTTKSTGIDLFSPLFFFRTPTFLNI